MAKQERFRLVSEKYFKVKRGQEGEAPRIDKKMAQAISDYFKQKAQQTAANPASVPLGQKETTNQVLNKLYEMGYDVPDLAAKNAVSKEPAISKESPFWKTKEFQDYVNEIHQNEQLAQSLPDERASDVADLIESKNYLQQKQTLLPAQPPAVLVNQFKPSQLAENIPMQVNVPITMATVKQTPGPSKAQYRGGLQLNETQKAAYELLTEKPVRQAYSLVTGQPIEQVAGEALERAIVARSYPAGSFEQSLAVGKYDLFTSIRKAAMSLGLPSIWTMQAATEDTPTAVGSLISDSQNQIMANYSNLKAQVMLLTNNFTADMYSSRASKIEAQVLNGEFDIPGNQYKMTKDEALAEAQKLRAFAYDMRQQQAEAQQTYKRFQHAADVDFNQLIGIDILNTGERVKPVMPNQPPPGAGIEAKARYAAALVKYQKELAAYNDNLPILPPRPPDQRARMTDRQADYKYQSELAQYKSLIAQRDARAVKLENESLNYYNAARSPNIDMASAQGFMQKALDAKILALKARREATPIDVFGSYTWASEPERYDNFLKDVAAFELQIGRKATNEEILHIKDTWVNISTDMVGQIIFDPINLIQPVSDKLVEEGVSLIGRGGKALRMLGWTDEVGKSIKPIDSVYRFFFEQAHTSVANELGRTVTDTLGLMKKGYKNGDEFINGMDDLARKTLELDRIFQTEGKDAFEAAFNAAKAEIPGLNELTPTSFRKFAEAFKDSAGNYYNGLSPDMWAKELLAGRQQAINTRKLQAIIRAEHRGEDVLQAAKDAEVYASDFINNLDKSNAYFDTLAAKLKDAYIDPHKAFVGSHLIEDTPLGYLTKKIAPHNMELARNIDNVSHVLVTMRNMWANFVLNLSPSRVIRNFMDSAGRDVIYGGNLWDDIGTLWANTQLQFVDDVGFIPVEFGQSLARAGLDIGEDVPSRLLYGEKPMAGVFSYWNFEAERLRNVKLMKGIENAATSEEIAAMVAEKMPKGMKGFFLNTWDGFRYHFNMKAVTAGLADYNTSIEFTLRTRMFHREYFNLIRQLEPDFKFRGMENLSPQAKLLAKEIWDRSGGSASRLAAYADSVIMNAEDWAKSPLAKAHPEWSVSLPEDFGKRLINPEQFTQQVRNEVDNWVAATYKTQGRPPTTAEIDKFVDDAKEMIDNEYMRQADLAIQHAEAGVGDIGQQTVHSPTMDELKGSAPTASSPSVSEKVAAFRKKRVPPTEALDQYKDIMSPVADVRRVKGNVATARVVTENGERKVVIEVGDSLLAAKNPRQFFSQLHNATIQSFALSEEEFIYAAGKDINTWTRGFKDFLADPLKMRNDAERDFMTFARQMDDNPDIFAMLQKTSTKVKDYQEAARNLRMYGALDYMETLSKREYVGLLSAQEHAAHPRLPQYWVNQDNARYAGYQLGKQVRESGNTELWTALAGPNGYFDRTEAMRSYLDEYTRIAFPGPQAPGTQLTYRGQAWRDRDAVLAAEAAWRYGERNRLMSIFVDEGPDAFRKALEEIPTDPQEFAKWYLEQNRFLISFDPETGKLLSATYKGPQNLHHIEGMQLTSMQKMFFDGPSVAPRRVTTLNFDGTQGDTFRAMQDAFMKTLGMGNKEAGAMSRYMTEQAKFWVEMGGESEEEYLSRYGWELIDGEMNWARTGQQIKMLDRGLFTKDPETGRMIFYGTSIHDLPSFMYDSSKLFLRDLIDLAEKNPESEAAAVLKVMKEHLGVKEGEVFTGPQMTKFKDTMMSYIINGKLPDVKLKRPYEAFRRSLARTYEGILGEQNMLKLPDDVVAALNKNFAAVRLHYPPSTAEHTTTVLLREAGVATNPDDLLKEINRVNTRRSDEALRAYIERRYGTNITPELRKKLLEDVETLKDARTGVENIKSIAHNPIPEGWISGMSDLNGLKAINDKFGHAKGDEVLTRLGDAVNRAVEEVNQEYGETVARVWRGGTGADEFEYGFRDQQVADKVFAKADTNMDAVTINIEDSEKVAHTKTGFSFGHATGANREEADKLLMEQVKPQALKEGKRALRGEMPLSIRDVGQPAEAPTRKFNQTEFSKWAKEKYNITDPAEVKRLWRERGARVREFRSYTEPKPSVQRASGIKLGDNTPLNPATAEKDFTTRSVTELPKGLQSRIQEEAKVMLEELKKGKAGYRFEGGFEPSTNPTWFSQIHGQISPSKDYVRRSLERIIKGEGKDTTTMVQRLKEVILDRIKNGRPDLELEKAAAQFGQQLPADYLASLHGDLYAKFLMGANLNELEDEAAKRGLGAIDAMLADGATEGEVTNFTKYLEQQGRIQQGLPAVEATPVVRPSTVGSERRGAPRIYNSLEDVPLEERVRAIKRMGGKIDPTVHKYVQQAFDTWKSSREFAGFPKDALTDITTLKKYLKKRYMETDGWAAEAYSRRLWDAEQFEQAVVNYHASDGLKAKKQAWDRFVAQMKKETTDLNATLAKNQSAPSVIDQMKTRLKEIESYVTGNATAPGIPVRVTNADMVNDILIPPVEEWQKPRGVGVWLRKEGQITGQREAAFTELDRLGQHLKGSGWNTHMLPEEVRAELSAWKTGAVSNKAQLISDALNGTGDMEGAIARVNRVMLDYNYRTRFDNVMRNIFPFWQFPSRSWPFWMQTLAEKPVIVAAYAKYMRMSSQFAYQAGAVSSTGKPLPSLEGYVPVPGTDLWFNPLAPMSFTYLLGMQASPDDVMYAAQNSDDNLPPSAVLSQQVSQMGPIYGFSPAPWMNFLAAKAFGIPDKNLPQWPISPLITLVPRWYAADFINKLNNMFVFGQSGLGNQIYPEASWHDYLVERDMLERLYSDIKSMNPGDARRAVNRVAQAIKEKGDNAMWKDAYQSYTNNEANHAWGAMFTGMYTKEFTDVDADLLALRNKNNLMKSALNNDFQSVMFDISPDDETAYQQYLDMQDVPEGWLYRLYTDIGWVRNEAGQTLDDPRERAKYLALKITQDQNNAKYYKLSAQYQEELQSELRAVPIGADWGGQVAPIYDRYYGKMDNIANLQTYSTSFGSNKPAGMIASSLRDKWWREIYHTYPVWDSKNETYDDYQNRVVMWKNNLQERAQNQYRHFTSRNDVVGVLGNLKPEQQLSKTFFQDLMAETNADGFQLWRKENDTVFDALNEAWKESYWSPYWDSHKDPNSPTGWKQGSAYTLADNDFLAQHPQPPTAEQLFEIVNRDYPGRFTLTEVQKWVNYDDKTNILSIQDRLDQTQTEDFKVRQDIWEMLSMLGPGKNRNVIPDRLDPIERDHLQWWYDSNGTLWANDPVALKTMRNRLQEVLTGLNLAAPDRANLVQFVEAEQSNRVFQRTFSDSRNMDWTDVQSVLNVYYDQGSKNFRKLYPEWYKQVVQPYFNARDTFGKQNAVWASYYMWKPTPANVKGVPQAKPVPYSQYKATQPYNLLENQSGMAVPKGSKFTAGKPVAGSNKALSPTVPAPNTVQGKSYLAGFNVPVGFEASISKDLAASVRAKLKYPDTAFIPRDGIVVLKSLIVAHPDWESFIKPLLIPPKFKP